PVAPDRQRPRSRYLGIELTDRSGGRVSRVGERLLSRGRLVLVQTGEVSERQVHLAADLEQRGGIAPAATLRPRPNAQGDGPNRLEVLRDLLPDLAVSAGRSAREEAVLVHKRDRQA